MRLQRGETLQRGDAHVTAQIEEVEVLNIITTRLNVWSLLSECRKKQQQRREGADDDDDDDDDDDEEEVVYVVWCVVSVFVSRSSRF